MNIDVKYPKNRDDMSRMTIESLEDYEAVLVKAGTGAGKSRAALLAADSIKPTGLAILYPNVSNKKQWIDEINKWKNELKNISSLQYLYMFTYNSMSKLYSVAHQVDVVIFDEAHNLRSPKRNEIYNSLMPYLKGKKKIYLSATIKPEEELLIFQPLKRAVTIYYDIKLSIRNKEITPIIVTLIKVPLSRDVLIQYEYITNKIQSEVRRASVNTFKLNNYGTARKRLLAKYKQKYLKKYLWHLYNNLKDSDKILVFVETITFARELYKFLRKDISVVHSKNSTAINNLALKDFNEGKTKILVAVNKLNEGVNIHNITKVLFQHMPRSTSHTLFQRIGRATRSKYPDIQIMYTDTRSEHKDLSAIVKKYNPVVNVDYIKNYIID